METRVDYLESNSPGVIHMNRESRSSGVSWER